MTATAPPWSPPSVPPEQPPAPRRKRWPWIAAAVVGVAAVGAVGAVILVGLDATVLWHDLITADFEDGAAPFETGSMSQYRASVEDGEYVLTATAETSGQAVSFASFTRPAYSVTVELTLVDARDAYGDNWFGVACLDRSSSSANGYELVLSGDGVALLRVSPSGAEDLASEDSTGYWPPYGEQVKIACAPSLDGDAVTVTGYVAGQQVLSATDGDGVGEFTSAAVVFRAFDLNDDLHVDDVIARVPGE